MKTPHIFLVTFCLMLATLTARAQQPAPIVRDIDVQYAGPAAVSKERIIANMRTKIGKPYSEQAVEEDVRSLYAMGNITNVRIFGEPVRDGVKVIVVVQTKVGVGEVLINGVTKLKVNSLRKKLTVKPGQPLNEANLETDRQKILEEYRKKGYSDTTVEYKVEPNEKANTSRVIFNITEGSKSVITAVRFEGNETFKSKVLLKQIKTRSKNLLSFITKAGQVENEQIDQDAQTLREYYQNHGYLDVEVTTPDIQRTKGERVDLVFHIKEGRQYHVGRVTLSPTHVFPEGKVRGVIKTTANAVFSPKGVRDDVKAVKDLYGAIGYIDLQVNAETSTGGTGIVNVDFKFDEGTQSYVDRVNIQNNSALKNTKDKVIRRELTLAPGDVYNSALADKSKARLENLNYFSRVDTYPSDTTEAGKKDFNVVVEEKKTGSLNFGAGFSSIDSLLGFAEIQQTNFDITNWPHFTGGGERFRARVQYGTERKDITISLTEPWFLDYQLAVGAELFFREASYISTYYNNRDYGIDLNARKPLGPFTSVRLDYRIEEIGIYPASNPSTGGIFGSTSTVVSGSASPAILAEERTLLKSSIIVGITHDTRDSVFLTRTGHRVDLSAYIAGGPLGGSENIYGFDATGSQYFHLPYDTIFLINGEVAAASPYSGSTEVPIWDRLFLGGANDLRGYSFHQAGPKDINGEPLGGDTMARITAEFTYPIIERVRGAFFYDEGFVSPSSFNFGGTLESDVGIGVRIDLPIGPVKLDYGFPLQHDAFTNMSGKFNFGIGYQF